VCAWGPPKNLVTAEDAEGEWTEDIISIFSKGMIINGERK